jgi:hypothetical protein
MGQVVVGDTGYRVPVVKIALHTSKTILAILGLLVFILGATVGAQDKDTDPKGKSDSEPKFVHLTIIVTGGDDKAPVDSASVYVKFVEAHTISRNKKIEMNLKTNLSGVCHVPEIPQGKFLIQIIAPGWKTFGEYYDVNQAEQTIKIALVRPPKWY